MGKDYGLTIYNKTVGEELVEELSGSGAVIWGDYNCDIKITNLLLCKLIREIRELKKENNSDKKLLSKIEEAKRANLQSEKESKV